MSTVICFFQVLAEDWITPETLNALACYCPCHLSQCETEHRVLLDLFFDRKHLYDQAGQQRRLTLSLILQLIATLPRQDMELEEVFRGCVYTGCLPDQHRWTVPSVLEPTRAAWALYVRNEILSLAIQAIFYVALANLEHHGPGLETSQAFAQWFLATPDAQEALSLWGNHHVAVLTKHARSTLPPVEAWRDPDHEFQLAYAIRRFAGSADTMLQRALQALLALAARDVCDAPPYGLFDFPEGYFSMYPINLQTLRDHMQGAWGQMSMPELLAWLVAQWGIDAHLRVALRKLRHESKDTFRVKPTEQGLVYIENTIPPVFTNPRFWQAMQILYELAAIDCPETGQYQLTPLGRDLLEDTCGS
jgi:hypothetical protein